MKSIASINTIIPHIENKLGYFSGESLRDYDIAIFDPYYPPLERIHFDAGGSCLSIDSTITLAKAMSHWSSEFRFALQAGKTIFIIMNNYKEDRGATGSTSAKGSRSYSTVPLNNYQALPIDIKATSSKGRKIVTVNSAYKGTYEAVKDIVSYRVIINSHVTTKIYTTKDGAIVGSVVKLAGCPGSMILLPYFDFDGDAFSERADDGEEMWTGVALKVSGALLSQLVAIDKLVNGLTELSPPPDWMREMQVPSAVVQIDHTISELSSQILEIQEQRGAQEESKADLMEFSYLLYETGKVLERSIEKSLRLLGYNVET